jgi:predicted ester cyclase
VARMSNKDTMTRFYEGISAGDLSVVDELLAEDFVEHDEFPGIPQSREGVKQFFSMARGAFPDLRLRVLHLVEEGDICVGHGLFEGTHEGDFMGVAPTGRSVSVPIADVVRFESSSGQAVEHWGVTDTGMMLQQLGVVPEPAS